RSDGAIDTARDVALRYAVAVSIRKRLPLRFPFIQGPAEGDARAAAEGFELRARNLAFQVLRADLGSIPIQGTGDRRNGGRRHDGRRRRRVTEIHERQAPIPTGRHPPSPSSAPRPRAA